VSRPSNFPPPFNAADFVAPPTDPADERIEVGVLIVGAGPAGLACAIRLGQLLEADPETAERLGEVPVALLEKGKQPGSHLLSGAVVNPRGLRRLFGEGFRMQDIPNYGEVHGEAVYVLTKRNALRIPPPPPMKNHGNWIFSLSQLGRYLAEKAEEGGAMILPETAAQKLLVDHGRVAGVRTGDKGRGREGQELPNFEPGSDLVAKITVLAEGTQGHLTGVAIDRFDLRGNEPQVWELGVKEVWKVAKPLENIVHTMGWPLRGAKKYREFGGSFIYPLGEDMVTIGLVVGLDYRDSELSVHDLLQELKTHPKIRKILEGGERLEWGAKTIPSGGFHSLPRKLHAPGLLLCGDGAGMVNIPRLKGVHYAIESGRLAAEAAFRALQRGETPATALASYDDAIRESFIWKDMYEVRDMRQVFQRGFVMGGAFASAMTVSKGKLSAGKKQAEPDADASLITTNRAASYPAPDGKLTFDKLSSVFASGNKTRDDQPNHIRIERKVPADVARMWAALCPAHVYEVGAESDDGTVTLEIAPSNCVQCGAITAKGGRLTPPEGGSGPEYTST
jgi:electron-transferring-flavoprotein dehydrogenase